MGQKQEWDIRFLFLISENARETPLQGMLDVGLQVKIDFSREFELLRLFGLALPRR